MLSILSILFSIISFKLLIIGSCLSSFNSKFSSFSIFGSVFSPVLLFLSILFLELHSVSFISSKNIFRVYRYPTKLPLSTVEIYLGFNGSFVLILYQLYKCPFHFGRLSIVSMILLMYSKHFSNSIKFKSYAATTSKMDNPIFVDDVLGTISGYLPS